MEAVTKWLDEKDPLSSSLDYDFASYKDFFPFSPFYYLAHTQLFCLHLTLRLEYSEGDILTRYFPM